MEYFESTDYLLSVAEGQCPNDFRVWVLYITGPLNFALVFFFFFFFTVTFAFIFITSCQKENNMIKINVNKVKVYQTAK